MFTQPTALRPMPLVAWSIIPNMHAFWLVDAINQNHPVPASHLLLLLLYGLSQIVAAISLAVILFQGRDVG